MHILTQLLHCISIYAEYTYLMRHFYPNGELLRKFMVGGKTRGQAIHREMVGKLYRLAL